MLYKQLHYLDKHSPINLARRSGHKRARVRRPWRIYFFWWILSRWRNWLHKCNNVPSSKPRSQTVWNRDNAFAFYHILRRHARSQAHLWAIAKVKIIFYQFCWLHNGSSPLNKVTVTFPIDGQLESVNLHDYTILIFIINKSSSNSHPTLFSILQDLMIVG